MNFIDLLRKIGVLRYGAKNYQFTKGSEIPPEALMDDVYNADKELFIKKDRQSSESGEDSRKKL